MFLACLFSFFAKTLRVHGGRRAPLTCLGRRVLLVSLEGIPEQQFIAPAARAHQNHADRTGVVPHNARGRRGLGGPEENAQDLGTPHARIQAKRACATASRPPRRRRRSCRRDREIWRTVQAIYAGACGRMRRRRGSGSYGRVSLVGCCQF